MFDLKACIKNRPCKNVLKINFKCSFRITLCLVFSCFFENPISNVRRVYFAKYMKTHSITANRVSSKFTRNKTKCISIFRWYKYLMIHCFFSPITANFSFRNFIKVLKRLLHNRVVLISFRLAKCHYILPASKTTQIMHGLLGFLTPWWGL